MTPMDLSKKDKNFKPQLCTEMKRIIRMQILTNKTALLIEIDPLRKINMSQKKMHIILLWFNFNKVYNHRRDYCTDI